MSTIEAITSSTNWSAQSPTGSNPVVAPAVTPLPNSKDTHQSLAQEKPKTEDPSFIRRVGEWFYSLFWCATPPITSTTDAVNKTISPICDRPSLEKPQDLHMKNVADALTKINHSLVHRMEDTRSFEDEMQSLPHKDHYILWELFQRGMSQKDLKEETAIMAISEVHQKQSHNRELNERAQELLDDIRNWAKQRKIPEWVGFISTFGTTGLLAASFVTGGVAGIMTLAIPLFTLTKGISTASKGMLDHRTDVRQGELFMLRDRRSQNTTEIQQRVDKLKGIDNDRLAVIKMIKEMLNNYHKTTQAIKK